MKMKRGILIIWLCLPFFVVAQSNDKQKAEVGTFKASLIFGVNAAQIHGDDLYGYDKLGLMGGTRVSVRVKPMWEASIEMLYAQKGSRSPVSLSNAGFPETIYSLDYVEIPLVMSYVDKGIRFHAGMSYARMVRLDILIASIDETEQRGPFYNKNDFNLFAGGGYQINDKWLAEVRWGRSPFTIVTRDTSTIDRQWNVWLSFRGVYTF